MGWRLYALIPADKSSGTRHTVGLPPELNEGKDERQPMPPAAVVFIFERPTGSALSYRYSSSGEFAGDTWAESIDIAQRNLKWEYSADLEWMLVPEEARENIDELLTEVLAGIAR